MNAPSAAGLIAGSLETAKKAKQLLTVEARSLWIQCPAPSRIWQPRNAGSVLAKFAICACEFGKFENVIARTRDEHGRLTDNHAAPWRHQLHDRVMLRYQFSPPRNPVRVNPSA